MSTIRTADGAFTTIANELLTDLSLSDGARGYACRLLSGAGDEPADHGWRMWRDELVRLGYLRQVDGEWVIGDAR